MLTNKYQKFVVILQRTAEDVGPYNYNITKGDISHPSGYITPKAYHKSRKEFIPLHYEVMPYPEILQLRPG